MLRNLILSMVAAGAILLLFFSNIPVNATVYKVNNNVVTFEVGDGNLYDWVEEDDRTYKVGDEVKLYMHDYESSDPKDFEVYRVFQ